VENLPGKPNAEYQAQLIKAQEQWKAGGEAQMRANRLMVLFGNIETAWKAGQWTDTLEFYDKVLEIDPNNKRVSRERPVALFCFMESLLQSHANSLRSNLKRENAKDKRTIGKLCGEAAQYDSVGMSNESQKALNQVAALEQQVKERSTKSKEIHEVIPSYFLSRYRQGGPSSVPKIQKMSFGSFVSTAESRWAEERFSALLWSPFIQDLSSLPPDELRYVEEFKAAYDKVLVDLRSKKKRARAALTKARGLVDRGKYTAASNLIDEAESLDASLSASIASLRSDLTRCKRSAEVAEMERNQANKRYVLWLFRILGALALLAVLVFWAWPRVIVPFFTYTLWRPFDLAWYIKLITGAIMVFVGGGLLDDENYWGWPILLYGAALLIFMLISWIAAPFSWEWYWQLIAGIALLTVGTIVTFAGLDYDEPAGITVGVVILLYGIAIFLDGTGLY